MVVITTKRHAPYTHNLVELAQKASLDLNKKQLESLAKINEFNLACRYPDYKYNFYKKCTKKFTNKYFKTTSKLLIWLKNIHIKNKINYQSNCNQVLKNILSTFDNLSNHAILQNN